MSESTSGSEFLLGIEEYLRYLKHHDQAEITHTLSRTMSLENKTIASVKAYMQDLGSEIQDSNRELADLLHGVVKSETIVDIQKSLLHFLGKTIDDQLVIDLIFSVIKSNTNETTYRALLQYIGKKEQVDNFTVDLIFGIIKQSSINVYRPLLQYISKSIEDKFLHDLIHGTTKSDDLLFAYKAVLQYTGRSLPEDKKSMADMAFAIQRAIDSDSFEDDFIKAHLSMLDRHFLNDKIFRGINNCIKSNIERTVINDAFSRSQIRSKVWLINELLSIDYNYDNILVMAGWFGQLKAIYEKQCTYAKMRILEIDKFACETSDYVFNLSNLENYKVKSVNADINNLVLHKNGYEWDVENFRDGTKYSEKFLPNLIINTSAEHMKEDWFFQIKFKELETDPIVAIQSNNLFDIDEHINCVHSVEHMKKKFPMREILYQGELQLKGYKRVMLIGRP